MGENIPNYHKLTNWPFNIPNGSKIFQSSFSDLMPSEIYPDWDFWFENKPSGNPGLCVRDF
jgi:hypothetical protein